uniref:UBIQUITIN_CONJUGAT_2 domain-containing protein n=1 Tax=Mesocestoides corti TaxID=53468 RepID=A0A5K3FJL6_MESCO
MSQSMGQRSFFKDVQQLYRKIDTSTDGQASIVSVNELSVIVSLNPKFGLNAHASFIVKIDCPMSYPKASPEVHFITPIFHPNVYLGDGRVCLSLLIEWHSFYSLLDVIKALIYVIEHPNFQLPNNDFASDEKLFDKKTLRLLAGLRVNGRRFAPNQAWCEWAEANGCLPVDDEELEDNLDDDGGAVHVEAQEEPNKRIESLPGVDTYTHDVEEDANTSDASSDTVPSFDKPRLSVDSRSGKFSETYYVQDYYCIYFKTQRILIGHPSVNNEPSPPSVFYYSELLGSPDRRGELGDLYNTLFAGDVLLDMQVHPDSRQTSSLCPWYFYHNSYPSSWATDSVFNQTNLFTSPDAPRLSLTADFCPWSVLDGLGTQDLLGLLYSEKGTGSRESDFSLGADDDGENLARIYNESPPMGGDSFFDAELEYSPQIDDEAFSLISSVTFYRTPSKSRFPRYSWRCSNDFNEAAVSMNVKLLPRWHWMFRQTRWPIRFAPQQNIELSMNGIRIPSWRASAGRLLSDVSRFCSAHREVKNLVLLDPMALSPLSPLLNLMRHSVEPKAHLTGILWMTPIEAISPFYRVPIPRQDEDAEGELDEHVYPQPGYLRFLTVTAFVSNWLTWFSRIETYSSLGITRHEPCLMCESMSGFVLQPWSLGCGQSPLIDLW